MQGGEERVEGWLKRPALLALTAAVRQGTVGEVELPARTRGEPTGHPGIAAEGCQCQRCGGWWGLRVFVATNERSGGNFLDYLTVKG
jgi:hypothetical protein